MINLHFFIPLNGYNIMPPCYTHKMAIVSDHGFSDVTSHYVLIFASALCLVVCSLQVLPRPQIRQSAQLVCMVTLRLTPVLTTDRVSGESNALGRVRPSVRPFLLLTFEPTDLHFCTRMGHDYTSPEIESQGHR